MEFKVKFNGRSHLYTEEEVNTVVSTMNSGIPLTQGKFLKEFESKFSQYIGAENCYAVNSATSALELSAQLCKFSKGDEFICPSHTYTATAYPFIKKGGRPVWADIDIKIRVVTLQTIKECFTDRTKAIVVVHLYGFIIPDIAEIAQFAKEKGVILIEDVAQAIGTEINGCKAGTFGDFGVFSFHSHKNMTTLGEGGMLVVKNTADSQLIPMLRHNGHSQWGFDRDEYWIPAMGNVDLPEHNGDILLPNNFCIGEVECALGAKLLDRLDEINEKKRTRAIQFIKALSEYDLLEFHEEDSDKHNYHLLVAYVNDGKRDLFMKKMSEEKLIQCVVQYYPLNRYDLYKKLGFSQASCPVTDEFFDNMVSFPFHHMLSDGDYEYLLQSTVEVLDEICK